MNEKINTEPENGRIQASPKPKISVIIPVYNQESYLMDCLNSLQNQVLKEWEAVCIDDGSSDSSLAILKDYAEADNRIRVYHQENQGVSRSRNRAIDLASGEFLFFLDPDDWVKDENVFSDLYRGAVENNVMVCGGSMELYDPAGFPLTVDYSDMLSIKPFAEDRRMSFREYQFHYGWTRFIYNRTFIMEKGFRLPEYSSYEDPVFFVKVMDRAEEFYAMKRTVYCYRKGHHSYQLSYNKILDLSVGMIDILEIAVRKNYMKLQKFIEKDIIDFAPQLIPHLDKDYANELRSNLQHMNSILYPGQDLLLICKLYANIIKYNDQLLNSTSWKIGSSIVRPLSLLRNSIQRITRK